MTTLVIAGFFLYVLVLFVVLRFFAFVRGCDRELRRMILLDKKKLTVARFRRNKKTALSPQPRLLSLYSLQH